jgi:pimeloyl-ACP methyl ester carboxylesterase
VTATAPSPLAVADLALPEGEDRTVTTDDGATLAVRVADPDAGGGAEGGVPIVLSHCWTGTRAVWAPVARRLVAAGHRVVLYDQRGHGSSDLGRDPLTVARLGADLAAVVRGVDVRGAVLAGHSMGGMSVMACACGHPDLVAERVRGLALVATAAHGIASRRRDRLVHLALRGNVAGRATARPGLGRVLVRGSFGRAPDRTHVDATRVMFVGTPPAVRRDAAAAMRAMDLREALCKVEVPAVVVLGLRDGLIVNPLTREIPRHLAGADLVELPRAGHMLPFERPDEVTAAIVSVACR